MDQHIVEQEQLLEEIRRFSETISFIERKIDEDGENFNPNDYADLFDDRAKTLYRLEFDPIFFENDGFIWPVDPDLGISAYFRDPNYVNVFGVRHSAIDLPKYQGTPIRAAANGIVYTAKDNGYGYSYIIIAHADNFMTVYGHVNSILVSEGQPVNQGSIIGLSGGMPGTKGAGYMTTGPHLHFEMIYNGNHVDPLYYLPLNILSEDTISSLPDKYHEIWLDQVFKEKVPR